jgi:hypothetical protein
MLHRQEATQQLSVLKHALSKTCKTTLFLTIFLNVIPVVNPYNRRPLFGLGLLLFA